VLGTARVSNTSKKEYDMEKNTAIGKFGVAFFAGVALALATAWIAGPELWSARAENDGASAAQSRLHDVPLNAAFANSAPFRDGLFQGTLAKQRGEQARVSQSRWAFGEDQSAYERGYQHAFAKHSHPRLTSNCSRRSEIHCAVR
jgi:hypothetical protein